MEIRKLRKEEFDEFKKGIQEAFQDGFERYFGKCDATIIPDGDILSSYNANGAETFVAVEEGNIVGGCIVAIDENTRINELHILYAKVGVQSKGVGFSLWYEMERLFPNTLVWKTCTPYFDQRNLHFYVNKCGFHVVKFIREMNENGFIGDAGGGMLEFEKEMKRR